MKTFTPTTKRFLGVSVNYLGKNYLTTIFHCCTTFLVSLFSDRIIRKLLYAIPSGPTLARFLMDCKIIGDCSAKNHPLARALRAMGIPRARVYGNFATWGFPPFVHKIGLSPVVLDFQTNSWRVSALFGEPPAPNHLEITMTQLLKLKGIIPEDAEIESVVFLPIEKSQLAPKQFESDLPFSPN